MKRMILIACFVLAKAHAQPSRPSAQKDREHDPRLAKSQKISEVSDSAVGVDLIQGSKKGVVVYPNPANDHIIVALPGENEVRQIRVVNSLGQPVLNIGSVREKTYFLDVTRLKKGIYLIEVVSRGNIARTRWIKN